MNYEVASLEENAVILSPHFIVKLHFATEVPIPEWVSMASIGISLVWHILRGATSRRSLR